MSTSAQGMGDPFAGPGEVRQLARQIDWSATPLGAVADWPAAFRVIVRSVLDSPFPINLWCGDDLVLIYNDAYRRVLGAKHPGSLGRPGAEVWHEIWHLIAPMFEQIRDAGDVFYSEDAPFIVLREESVPATADQEPNAWFTFSLSPVRDDAGRVMAYLNIVSETTARVLAERALQDALDSAERAEAHLREIFAQAPAFMALMRGPEHIVEYANDAYFRLTGYRELIGRPVFDALPEVRGQGFETLLETVRNSGTPYVGREVPIMVARKRGAEQEQRFLDFVYYPIRGDSPDSSGVVAHGYDVTEHVLAREEARRARMEAELANQAKSQFLANMSHEIRTPINAVVGYTDLLEANIGGTLTERQADFVDRIRSSSRHLLALVNDVLDLAKIEAGEMLVRSEPVDLAPIVTESVQMVTPEAERRSLDLRQEWHCEGGECLGDADRIRQVLLNLLSNAVKFTPDGGSIVVRCRLRRDSPPDAALPETGPWLAIDVEDTGVGIAPEQQARIFHAFVQAESGLTRTAGGTGLGLTISRRLARIMSGDLTLRSEAGRGSCFTLWLPVVHQQPLRHDPAEVAPGTVDPFLVVGDLLLERTEMLERDFTGRLRAELAQRTNTMDDRQIADHTAAFIAGISRTVTALNDPDSNVDLLEDGEEMRAYIARRHGRQRVRHGWTHDDLEREYQVLADVLAACIASDAPKRTSLDLTAATAAVRRMVQAAGASALAAGSRPG